MSQDISKYVSNFESLVPSREIERLIQEARAIDVKTKQGAQRAASILSAAASYAEIVDNFWGPIEKAAFSTWKAIKDAADRFRSFFSQDAKFRSLDHNIRGILEPKLLELDEIPEGVEGIYFRNYREAEVYDFKALVKACTSGRAPLELLSPNMSALNKLAAAMQESPYPGVRFESKKGLVVKKMA